MKYHIKHFGKGKQREEEFHVLFGDKIVLSLRAKSRSKKEMQRLLNHMNKQLKGGWYM
jgi:1,2-phenylacetyl-CoA epoxidase catalytic subunit